MSRWRLLRAWHRCFVLFFFFFSSHFHRFVTMRPCDPRPWIISILRRINGWRDEKNRWIHEIIGQWIWISVEGGGKSGFWRFTFSFFFVGIRFIYRFEFLAKSGNRSLHEFEWNKRKSASILVVSALVDRKLANNFFVQQQQWGGEKKIVDLDREESFQNDFSRVRLFLFHDTFE